MLSTAIAAAICSCGNAKNAVVQQLAGEYLDALVFPAKANSVFTLKKDVDLGGKTYVMPEDVTIKVKEGVIKNGTIVGKNTKIAGKEPVFDKVTIKGDWYVPEINTSMFKDLSYDNSLRDVMALTNEAISNSVEIEAGQYHIKLVRNQEIGIYIRSNTYVTLNGDILLRPNAFTNYNIVEITGENCALSGAGSVVGDKPNHTGTTGEWGMGVEFAAAKNASVSGIAIKDCWGDCIYVGDKSSDITIENCAIDNGRRQGISVTSADGVKVSNCVISNISGTAPESAIDLEPNANEIVSNVTITNVMAINCVGGFEIWGKAKNAKVSNVLFSNCSVTGVSSKYPMLLMTAERVTIESCNVDSDSDYSILTQEIVSLKVQNNTLKAKGKKPLNVLQCKDTEFQYNKSILKK